MSKKQLHPPKWADRFLAWYCNPKLLEQIQGDVHELFYWKLSEEGPEAAKRMFIWNVIRLFRWSNIKRKSKRQKQSNMGIFKNYFKIGLRNLWKQRLPSTINIIGLSLAIGCSLVVFKFVEYNYVKDDFHENLDDLFLVTHAEDLEYNKGRSALTDNTLSKEILASVPGIKYSTRCSYRQLETRVEKMINYNSVLYVDPDFTDMFSFELLAGNPNAMNSADYVAMNESSAKALFGEQSAIDQKLELKIGDEWKVFTVGAVYRDNPANSSIRIEILINYIHLNQLLSNTRDTWDTNFFIQRQDGVEESNIVSAMNELLPIHNKDNEVNPYISFELEPFKTMANNSDQIFGGLGTSPQFAAMLTLTLIAVFMLLLATLNYVNISLAMVMKRLKEIGVRKVIGGKRRQLITQFLIENLLLCFLSILLGMLFAHSFFLPGFNSIAGSSFNLNILSNARLVLFLLGLWAFITIASGLYPAVVASSFKPISILRKSTQRSGNRMLSNIFLTFQMILAMVTIVAAVMFVHTNRVNRAMDWGYDQYDKLVVGIPEDQYKESFRDYIASNPSVEDFAGTKSIIGQSLNGVQFKNGEVKSYAELFSVGRNYPTLLGLELIEGRLFDPELDSDLGNKLIVNSAFLERFQLTFDPDGTTIMQDSVQYSILGVVDNFHYADPGQGIRGAAMTAISEDEYTAYMAKMVDGDIFEQREEVLESLQEFVKERTVYIGIQSLLFDRFYDEVEGIGNIMIFTATISILLAAMGLYGLVNINVTSHIKDFGIRKVLGANRKNLAKTVLSRFLYVLLIAILIGCPTAVLLVETLLNDIQNYAPSVGFGPLLVSVSILLFVAIATLNIQIERVRKMNPTETLRAE